VDRLRELWDFGDLDATEVRLRERLAHEPGDDGRAEVLTQLARVEGLRDEFEAAERLLVEAEGLASSDVARTRIDLERGRALRSSGDPDAATPLFVAAYERAVAAGQGYIAGDAAHMAAIVDPAWVEPAIAFAESSEDARYWLGPLWNNVGWSRFEAGDAAGALDAFERALAVRDTPAQRAIARYAVARALGVLQRHADAVEQLENAIGEAPAPDGWFHEELAEDYAALGRLDDAREHAGVAIPLLQRDDPSFGGQRAARLGQLCQDPS
jgi:tetratricopeptide (TPR) repeat protein